MVFRWNDLGRVGFVGFLVKFLSKGLGMCQSCVDPDFFGFFCWFSFHKGDDQVVSRKSVWSGQGRVLSKHLLNMEFQLRDGSFFDDNRVGWVPVGNRVLRAVQVIFYVKFVLDRGPPVQGGILPVDLGVRVLQPR